MSVKDERESGAASRFSRRHANSSSSRRGGGGRFLMSRASAAINPKMNVTDKNGAYDTMVNCMLDKSSATAERIFGVGKTSLNYEQP